MSKRQVPPELSQLLGLAKLGLKIIPCQYVKGKKKPVFKQWQQLVSADPSVIEGWYYKYPGCMWGVAMGAQSGVLVVDVDVKDGKRGDVTLKKLLGGRLPKTASVRTPSGGLHYYFRCDDPSITGGAEKLGPGLDFIANGRYAIVPPSVLDGKQYEWITPLTSRSLVDLPRELIPQRPASKVKSIVTTSSTFEDDKRKALWAFKYLDPMRAESYQDWVEVLMSAGSVSTTDQDIVDELEKFSRRSAKYRPGDVEQKLATFNNERGSLLTIGSLIQKANEDRPKMLQAASDAAWEVARMSHNRFVDPESRLEVGKALVFLGDLGKKIWLDRCSTVPGVSLYENELIWRKLKLNGVGQSQLEQWAEADEPEAGDIPQAPSRPLYRHYEKVLSALNFKFYRNDMNDMVCMNGVLMDDFILARVHMTLKDYGYKSKNDLNDSILLMADKNRFHPVQQYLRALTWNGEDSIGALAAHFVDVDNIFPILLRKWLIGAVNKVMSNTGEFNPMLVLDGPQRVGKSKFVRWLCKSIPGQWALLDAINLDRDQKLKLCNYFILEAPEIAALHSRSDREALKVFLSMEAVHERALYGRYPLNKPCTASFIGTLNNVGGFLSDSTGESRYRPCTILYIDWRGYTRGIDVDQVWAQAVALYDAGETIDLDSGAQETVNRITQSYKMEDSLLKSIETYFDITRDGKDWMEAYDIEKILRDYGAPLGLSSRAALLNIASVLNELGLTRKRVLIREVLRTVWYGIRPRQDPTQPFDTVATAAEVLFNAKVKK